MFSGLVLCEGSTGGIRSCLFQDVKETLGVGLQLQSRRFVP